MYACILSRKQNIWKVYPNQHTSFLFLGAQDTSLINKFGDSLWKNKNLTKKKKNFFYFLFYFKHLFFFILKSFKGTKYTYEI